MRFLKFGKVAGAVVAGAAVATVLAAPAASAAPAPPESTVIASAEVSRTSVLSYPLNCFGYTGEFKDGSTVILVQWRDGSRECFGIAPNRTIWHAWQTAVAGSRCRATAARMTPTPQRKMEPATGG